MKAKVTIILLCLLSVVQLKAQFWQADDVLLQDQRVGIRSMAFNRPEYRLSFSIPVLGQSQQTIYHSGFAYTDLVNSSGEVTAEEALNNLKELNFAGLAIRQNWLNAGFYAGETWIRISVDEDVDMRLDYPGDLMKLAWYGNGSDQFLGKRVALDGLGIHFQQRRNYLVGFARESRNRKWNYGANLRVIQGIACLLTTKSKLGWTTDATDYTWSFDGEMQIRSSGIVEDEDLAFNSYDLVRRLTLPKGNLGFSADAGVSYSWDDQWKSWVNVSDIGYIRWNQNITSYSRENASLVFRGFDVQEYYRADTITDLTQSLLDSLPDQLVPLEDNQSFDSRLTGNYSLGVSRSFGEKHLLMLQLMRNSLFDKSFYGVNFSYRFEPWPRFGMAVSGGYHHLFGAQAGVGICLRLGALVINAGTGNIPALLSPESVRMASFHFGMNLVFNRPDGRYR